MSYRPEPFGFSRFELLFDEYALGAATELVGFSCSGIDTVAVFDAGAAAVDVMIGRSFDSDGAVVKISF